MTPEEEYYYRSLLSFNGPVVHVHQLRSVFTALDAERETVRRLKAWVAKLQARLERYEDYDPTLELESVSDAALSDPSVRVTEEGKVEKSLDA